MHGLNSRMRKRLYPYVMAKQGGEYCIMCYRTPAQLQADGLSPQLCIDHINNRQDDNRIANLQFLCHSCNTRKNHPTIEPQPDSWASRKNRQSEPVFGRWLLDHFITDPDCALTETYVIGSGATIAGCSTATIERYMLKKASDLGMYIWHVDDSTGLRVLRLKPEHRE